MSSNRIHTRTKDTTVFWLTKADGNDDERVLPTKWGESELGKERETRFSLTSSRTKKQRPADTISHRKQHPFTSLSENSNHPNFRWTRNPTWKPNNRVKHLLNTQCSLLQQRPTNTCWEIPSSSWKCCRGRLPLLWRTPDQYWHPNRFLPNSSPSTPRRFHSERYCKKFYLPIIIERHLRALEALLDMVADITLMSTELLEEVQERTKRTNGTLKLHSSLQSPLLDSTLKCLRLQSTLKCPLLQRAIQNYIYISAFSRRFYPKRLTSKVDSAYTFFCQ